MLPKESPGRQGFTLIEILIVVIIIAALAGIVMPRLLPVTDEAKRDIAKAGVANISVALKLYYLHNGRYPTTEEGLKALRSRPASAVNWRGPYLEKAPLDPWKREFQYRCPGQKNSDSFDLWSLGPSESDPGDDVTNWED